MALGVASVGDADNFRLYHTPGVGWRFPLRFRRVPTLGKGAFINICYCVVFSFAWLNKNSKTKRSTFVLQV